MIGYKPVGLDALLERIRDIDVADDGGDRVEIRGDKVIVSFKTNGAWIVYIAKQSKRWYKWSHGYFDRVESCAEKAGFCLDDLSWLRWSHIFLQLSDFSMADHWLCKKLGITEFVFKSSMWTREFAIEYTMSGL